MTISLEELLWRASVDGEDLHVSGLEGQALVARMLLAEKRIEDAIGFIKRNATEHCCSGSDEIDVDAAIAILMGEGDPRDTEHVECDCLPKYGPPHCHLCSQIERGHSGDWNYVAKWPCAPSLG